MLDGTVIVFRSSYCCRVRCNRKCLNRIFTGVTNGFIINTLPFCGVRLLESVACWNPKWFPLADPTRHKEHTVAKMLNCQQEKITREHRARVRKCQPPTRPNFPGGNKGQDRKGVVSGQEDGKHREDNRESNHGHKRRKNAVLRNVWRQKTVVPGKVRVQCSIVRLAKRREGVGTERLADLPTLPHSGSGGLRAWRQEPSRTM